VPVVVTKELRPRDVDEASKVVANVEVELSSAKGVRSLAVVTLAADIFVDE